MQLHGDARGTHPRAQQQGSHVASAENTFSLPLGAFSHWRPPLAPLPACTPESLSRRTCPGQARWLPSCPPDGRLCPHSAPTLSRSAVTPVCPPPPHPQAVPRPLRGAAPGGGGAAGGSGPQAQHHRQGQGQGQGPTRLAGTGPRGAPSVGERGLVERWARGAGCGCGMIWACVQGRAPRGALAVAPRAARYEVFGKAQPLEMFFVWVSNEGGAQCRHGTVAGGAPSPNRHTLMLFTLVYLRRRKRRWRSRRKRRPRMVVLRSPRTCPTWSRWGWGRPPPRRQ